MARLGRHITAAGLLLAAALVVVLAWYIANTQADARATMRGGLDQRALLTARLVRGVLTTTAPATGGPRRARGPLAGDPDISDLQRDGGSPHVMVDVAAGAPPRRHVVRLRWPLHEVAQATAEVLAAGSALPGAQAWIVDGRGRVLSGTRSAVHRLGAAAPAAIRRARRGAVAVDGDLAVAAAVVPSARWRVVITAPTAALYASVNGPSRTLAWGLFTGFALAVAVLVALGFAAVRRGRRQAAARERGRASRALTHAQLHDPLTGLPNRRHFEDRAEHALRAARDHGQGNAVVVLDLDHFKRINDSFGHAAGDAVLVEVAGRLEGVLGEDGTLSRFGGDEFLILLEDVSRAQALRVVAAIRAALTEPIAVAGRSLSVECSAGVALLAAGDPRRSAADLVQEADTAMYRAKGRGRGRVEVSDADLQRRALERLDQETALRAAIDGGELLVHYQPIVALASGRLHGVEALVRWRRPGRGLVPPGEFIPLAEETGLIADLGRWVLRRAVQEVGSWERRGLLDDAFSLSVNVSAHQLADPDFPAHVADALGHWDRAPASLCLELTETAVMAEPDAATEMLERLAALGVTLALDDFGVGHSSLGQLARSLPISVLKLDRSFVAGMASARDHGIVEAASHLARALRLTSVAEGVETPAQARALTALGFDLGQGFHFGRPVDGEQLMGAAASGDPAGRHPGV